MELLKSDKPGVMDDAVDGRMEHYEAEGRRRGTRGWPRAIPNDLSELPSVRSSSPARKPSMPLRRASFLLEASLY